jgi:hypothetical protein
MPPLLLLLLLNFYTECLLRIQWKRREREEERLKRGRIMILQRA